MKHINWKIRRENIVYIGMIAMSVLAPILSYLGLNLSDITTWDKLFMLIKNALLNPYILILVAISVFNATIDPTTRGLEDSERAKNYDELG